jgi:mRNA interferase RelE/StbE
VTDQPYAIELARPVRHALAERLPLDVTVGAMDFINGPLANNPHQVGKQLDQPYDGMYSARMMRE